LFEIYGRVARGGPPERFETYVAALSMWFEISAYCPAPEHFVAVFDVISERKTTEASLKVTLAEQRAILNSGVVGLVKVRERTIVWANRAFENLLGYAPGGLRGESTRAIYPDDETFDKVGRGYETLRAGTVWRTTVALLHLDGTPVWGVMSGSTMSNGESVWAWVDITEQHLAQEQLRKLSLAVEQSTNSVVITDCEARIEYVNAAFSASSGYAADEVVGRNLRFLQSGRTPHQDYIRLWDALNRGDAWRGEMINRSKTAASRHPPNISRCGTQTASSPTSPSAKTSPAAAPGRGAGLHRDHQQAWCVIAPTNSRRRAPGGVRGAGQ